MEPLHEVELNFFYLHYQDALKLSERAEKENSKLCSMYSRNALMSIIFAAEALINRVANDFFSPQNWNDSIDKLSLPDKWFITPLVCRNEKEKPQTYDKSREPFQSFLELVKIRNWLVHPKPSHFIDAYIDPNSSVALPSGEVLPWVETLKGQNWPQTRIPKNPFELNASHAKKAIQILDAMIEELKVFLKDRVTDSWLSEIEIKEKGNSGSYKIPVKGLWGGYTPAKTLDE